MVLRRTTTAAEAQGTKNSGVVQDIRRVTFFINCERNYDEFGFSFCKNQIATAHAHSQIFAVGFAMTALKIFSNIKIFEKII
jgi:hypothetical protein